MFADLLCRTCEGFDDLTSIFQHVDATIPSKLMSCANIKVCEDDGLPQQICHACIKELKSAFEFKQRCEDLDFKFRELSNVKIEITEPLSRLSMQNTDIKPEGIADNNYDNFQELENKIDPGNDYSKVEPGGGDGGKILFKTLGQEFAKPTTAKDEQAKSMICPGCDLTFTKYSQLIQHKKAHGKYSYLCKICKDRWFKNKAKLNSHERTHKNITEISFHECEICLKKYSNICNLRRHIKLHNNDKRYECDVCKKKFIQSNALREHKLTHSDQRDYPCADCDKAFKTQRYLERHREYIHDDLTKANSFPCQLCSRKFQSERNLLWHLKRHEENRFVTEESSTDKSKWHEPQSLSCRFCGKTFKQGSIVKIHERIHTGEKPYLCRNCGKTFSQSSQLLCHERFHTQERPYVCKICAKSFKFPRSLKDHINVHTGERPYICKVCNQGFKQRVHLHQHSLGHTGEKPHKCTHCGKGFRLKGNLHIHLRIHTGERPYLCKICGLRFIDLNGLKKHGKRHDLF